MTSQQLSNQKTMKTALLFAILALSTHAFAQSTRPASDRQHPKSKSIENAQRKMEDGGWKTPGILSENNSQAAIKKQRQIPGSFIQS